MLKKYMEQIIEQVKFEYDPGVSADIDAAFRDDERIGEYNLKIVKENKIEYRVYAKLKKYETDEASKLFFEVLHFIEFGNGSFYVREITKNTIEYYLISSSTNDLGFYFHVIFEPC